jgi:predicted DNA-binding transcriptional regulator AlpA
MVMQVEDLQKALCISRNIAYKLMDSNGFPSMRIGRRRVVPIEAFNKWLMQYAGKDFSLDNAKHRSYEKGC